MWLFELTRNAYFIFGWLFELWNDYSIIAWLFALMILVDNFGLYDHLLKMPGASLSSEFFISYKSRNFNARFDEVTNV